MKKVILIFAVILMSTVLIYARGISYLDVTGQGLTQSVAYNEAWRCAQLHMQSLGLEKGEIISVSYEPRTVHFQKVWLCLMTVRCYK